VLGHGQGRAVGPLEVVGSGCGSDARISGVDQLESLGHPAVQQRTARRADLAVRGGAKQVVDEVVAGRRPGADDPPPPQLVHRADQRVAVEVAGRGEEVKGEVAADHRRQLGDLACGRPGLCDAPG